MKILIKEENTLEENTLFDKESFDDLYFKKEILNSIYQVLYNKNSKGRRRVLDIYNSLTDSQIGAWKNLIKAIKNNEIDIAVIILKEAFQIQKRDAEIIILEIMLIELRAEIGKSVLKIEKYLFNQKLT